MDSPADGLIVASPNYFCTVVLRIYFIPASTAFMLARLYVVVTTPWSNKVSSCSVVIFISVPTLQPTTRYVVHEIINTSKLGHCYRGLTKPKKLEPSLFGYLAIAHTSHII